MICSLSCASYCRCSQNTLFQILVAFDVPCCYLFNHCPGLLLLCSSTKHISLRCLAVILAGKLVREVSISTLLPQCVVSAMQLVGHQQHHSRLAIAVSGSELVSWVHISDGAATEAVLAGRFAAMHVEQAGKCSS